MNNHYIVDFNPVALSLGPLSIHWYALTYILGFAAFIVLARYRLTKTYYQGFLSKESIETILGVLILSSIIGARIVYAIVYGFDRWAQDFWWILRIHEGGLSFHGALIVGMGSLVYLSKRFERHFLDLSDFFVPLVLLGLGFGRIGNFINGELWGRASNLPWAMIFPNIDLTPRHPSQIYQSIMEGFLPFIFFWWFSAKPKSRGIITSLALIWYAASRMIIEFFRAPDPQLGFYFGIFTMGQLLSLLMLCAGVGLFIYSLKHSVSVLDAIKKHPIKSEAKAKAKAKSNRKKRTLRRK